MFNQRDIVLVDFPFTDLINSKPRPALIISGNKVNGLNDFVCVQITSKEFYDGLYYPLQPSFLTQPLKLESGVRLHKIFTVHRSRMIRKISSMKIEAFSKLLSEFSKRVLEI